MRCSILSLLFGGLLLTLPACNSRHDAVATETIVEDPAVPGEGPVSLGRQRLQFGGPAFVDSSAYVLYPLVLKAEEEESRLSSSYGGSAQYWNIVFYNPRTGEAHPLAEGRRMVIYSYRPATDRESSGEDEVGSVMTKVGPVAGYQQARQLLLYSVVTDDYNHDGTLDTHDPTYYFVSDRAGRGFRQVSPPGRDAIYWSLVQGTSKVLLAVVQDSNNDKRFDRHEDTVVPLVVDLATGQLAAPVFSRDFTTKLKTQLARHWGKRE